MASRPAAEEPQTDLLVPEAAPATSYTFLGPSKLENEIPTYSVLKAGGTIYTVGDNVLVNCGDFENPWVAKILLFYRDPSGNMVYVSYWYYKRQDIPSGVKNRPPGKEKTPGELYFSTHLDENKVQTLMGTCKVFNRPLWLEQGSKKAPLHHHFCTKVYDLQAQLVDDAEKYHYSADSESEDEGDVDDSGDDDDDDDE